MNKINDLIVCGGGSGGHVLPALTVIREVKKKFPDVQITCIGSYEGIESRLFQAEGLPYKGISTGKLRRYLSWQNLTDIFRILWGTIQSFFFCLKFSRSQSVVFCTGGFVTVPVALACWLQGKNIYVHEQTSRVGLANKICSTFAKGVMVTFEASKKFFPAEKTKHIGYPLREEIFQESPLENEGQKPILFLTGGGNGSSLLNKTLFSLKDGLIENYQIIHQCGKAEFSLYSPHSSDDYKVYEFVGEEMINLLDKAQIVISRAGAGTVIELMALGKPSIFVPLKIAQKNEQFHNAMEAHNKLGSIVIEEDQFNEESLREAITKMSSLERAPKETKNPTGDIVAILMGEK